MHPLESPQELDERLNRLEKAAAEAFKKAEEAEKRTEQLLRLHDKSEQTQKKMEVTLDKLQNQIDDIINNAMDCVAQKAFDGLFTILPNMLQGNEAKDKGTKHESAPPPSPRGKRWGHAEEVSTELQSIVEGVHLTEKNDDDKTKANLNFANNS